MSRSNPPESEFVKFSAFVPVIEKHEKFMPHATRLIYREIDIFKKVVKPIQNIPKRESPSKKRK